MQIPWNEIASWGFGFFALPLTIAVAVGAGYAFVGIWGLPSYAHLNQDDFVCGIFIFIAALIITGVAFAKLVP